ncbi:Clathrin assembly protein [Musa troglodytarum]|uniref:Clathrin assembly protein n=1 Tax=Musa troglodytarum TaxID=320322 RepID=A0A9E7K9R9_9LILI|nr:Clathrin assembly protein [Musa troglodytarum]
MAPSIRKALGTVKDQTSIGLAKVSSNIAPELDVAIVKATSHDDEPANEKYLREILSMTSYSRGYVSACIATVSKRLGKTRDWVVALKALMLVHRLLIDGEPAFQHEILYATRRGTRLLNMSDFRDEAHSNSWDHSAFVRTYALYLDQRLECMVYERKQGGGNSRSRDHDPYAYGSYGRSSHSYPPERVLGRMHHFQQLLDRFLACRPTGNAKFSRMILTALYPIVRESFQLYADICEILAVLLDRFFDMDYPDCVQRITDKLLETLEEFMRDRARRPKSPPREAIPAATMTREEEPEQDMNSIKALPAPSDYKEDEPEPAKVGVEPVKQQPQQQQTDLVDLREDGSSTDDQSNKFALALFQGSVAGSGANAEPGKADWEIVLTIGQDPFAASLSIPPPSYVQMADVEKKQQLLVQEQVLWQHYAKDGMQGQSSLAKLSNVFIPNPTMPYGMPTAYNTAGGYYYPTY